MHSTPDRESRYPWVPVDISFVDESHQPMESIDALEDSRVLKEGNPSPQDLEQFYAALIDESDENLGLQTYYCERIVQKFFQGPVPENRVEALRKNLYEITHEEASEDLRRLAYLTIGFWYIESGDYYSVDGILVDWEFQIGENAQYFYLSSQKFLMNLDQSAINSAIEDAFEAKTRSSSDYFRYNIARVLEKACDSGYSYTGDENDIPSQQSVMLELSDDMIETALGSFSDHPNCHITKAKISIKMKNWNEAKAAINQGFEIIRSARNDYTQYFLELRLLQYQADSRKETSEIRDSLDEYECKIQSINSDLTSISDTVDDKKEEIGLLEERVDNSRVRFLQFLGFFSGLLAVAVTSTQVIASVDDFDMGFKLIMSLTGALLIAFGGFSTMFIRRNKPADYIPPVIMILLGAFGIAVSVVIHG